MLDADVEDFSTKQNFYALIIRYPGHEQLLYMEEIEPDKSYVYKPDLVSNIAGIAAGPVGTLGNVLLAE